MHREASINAFANAAAPMVDQRVVIRDVPWAQYEALLETRGESASPRMTYLDGDLELMSPSKSHEVIKKSIARLLEAYADETELDMNGFGSWTIKSAPKEKGAEPDECYVFGAREADVPDLAIEVVWTSGGIDKLAVYAALGVREVWIWSEEKIAIFRLVSGRYKRFAKSRFLPRIDLALVARLATVPNQREAVRTLRASLRRK